MPLIDNSSAWFDCSLHQVVDAGDHAILIGKVEGFESNATAGLGYYRGAYFTPYQNAQSLIGGPQVVVSALIEFEGHAVMVRQNDGGYQLPSSAVEKRSVSETLGSCCNSWALMPIRASSIPSMTTAKSTSNTSFSCARCRPTPAA